MLYGKQDSIYHGRNFKMATRTAPTFDPAAPTGRAITIHVMDVSGDTFTQRLIVAIGATTAAIEAWIALYQAVTNTTIWRITQELFWEGDADPDNATAAFRSGAENGINLLFKDADTLDTFTVRVVGPVSDTMQGNQDVPMLNGGSMDEFILATLTLAPDYNLRSSQYTTRRERSNNPKIR